MSFEVELEQALYEFKKRDINTFIAKVINVDKKKGICIVSDDEIEYPVRLASVINDDSNKFEG